MTSNYEELVNRGVQKDDGHIYQVSAKDIVEYQEAIRALTTQVVERDAVIEEVRSWRKFWAGESPILSSRAEFADLDGVLSKSPHDSLVARDAVRDKTVRATALRDAARAIANGDEPWSIDPAEPWLAARADQEGGKETLAEKWQYATTEGPRKRWDDYDVPPEGEGWELDPDRGRPGESWERFDYTEERYWRRLV